MWQGSTNEKSGIILEDNFLFNWDSKQLFPTIKIEGKCSCWCRWGMSLPVSCWKCLLKKPGPDVLSCAICPSHPWRVLSSVNPACGLMKGTDCPESPETEPQSDQWDQAGCSSHRWLSVVQSIKKEAFSQSATVSQEPKSLGSSTVFESCNFAFNFFFLSHLKILRDLCPDNVLY